MAFIYQEYDQVCLETARLASLEKAERIDI